MKKFLNRKNILLAIVVAALCSFWAFNPGSKAHTERYTVTSEEGTPIDIVEEYDEVAMKSSIVYSFTLDTLTNTESTTFTIADVFSNPYDLLVQGWMDEISGTATVIFQTQVSTADSGTAFWTTVQSDTLTADGTFVVNAATPGTVVIPRTMRRCRVVVDQTGTAVSSVDLQVSAKRFPN